jgi:hypothetical protein
MRSTLLAVLVLALAAPAAFAHPERQAYFPDGSVGAVPELRRTAEQVLTVCKRDSAGSNSAACASSSSAASATSRPP